MTCHSIALPSIFLFPHHVTTSSSFPAQSVHSCSKLAPSKSLLSPIETWSRAGHHVGPSAGDYRGANSGCSARTREIMAPISEDGGRRILRSSGPKRYCCRTFGSCLPAMKPEVGVEKRLGGLVLLWRGQIGKAVNEEDVPPFNGEETAMGSQMPHVSTPIEVYLIRVWTSVRRPVHGGPML